MSELGDLARKLRSMDSAHVNGILARHLDRAHPPVTLAIRRNVLAIPVKGTKHTGLRARIAGAVDGWSRETTTGAQVGVAVFPGRTFGGNAYYTLPLYMEGAEAGAKWSRWRHPVYGNPEVWRGQDSHEYFYGPASLLSVTADIAIRGALDEITQALS
jgi:hypothetical protein